MDAEGLSGLLLLGSETAGSCALLLARADRAMLQRGTPEGGPVIAITANWTSLPIASHSVDRVAVDLEQVPQSTVARAQLAAELRRVLTPSGCCVAVATHRRRPRDRRDLLGYRVVAPLRRWLPVLEGAGLMPRRAALVRFEGTRLVEIGGLRRVRSAAEIDGNGDAAAVAFSLDSNSDERSVVEALCDRIAAETSAPVVLERLLIRKIGKSAAFLRSGDQHIVARIARSPIAASRATRNYETVTALHGGETAMTDVRRLAPRPLWHGRIGGYAVFAEECRPGVPRQANTREGIGWEAESLAYLLRLHGVSARRTRLGDEAYERLVAAPLRCIARHAEDGEQRETLEALGTVLRRRLLGRELPLVRTHGDFTADNCLYGSSGRLTGVIDWELSEPQGLPLLDLIQALDIPGESSRDATWRRADLVLDAVNGRGPLAAARELTEYAHGIGLNADLVAVLLVVHWVDHIGRRIDARRSDAAWMQRRFRQPLARLREIVSRWQEASPAPQGALTASRHGE